MQAAATSTKRLIVTADDFGASTLVNEAIEQAHRGGILTTTCLMVAGAAAPDAVARAKRMPELRVGLHVVVVDGEPLLDPARVPALVDENGAFSRQLVREGFNFFFNRVARAQLEDEITAQFEAFRATGLKLDHINAHNHMHLHPTVLEIMLRVGRRYHARAIRVPYEPLGPSWRAMHTDLRGRFGNAVLLRPMLGYVRAQAHRAGMATNDFVFGLGDTGHMTRDRVLALLRELPHGTTEMYFHPATKAWRGMPADAQPQEELAALLDPLVRDYLKTAGIELTTFSALAAEAA